MIYQNHSTYQGVCGYLLFC